MNFGYTSGTTKFKYHLFHKKNSMQSKISDIEFHDFSGDFSGEFFYRIAMF